jgi:hypothetical protein
MLKYFYDLLVKKISSKINFILENNTSGTKGSKIEQFWAGFSYF